MSKRRVEARYWYFITEKDMGGTMSLTPRKPWGMSDGEPATMRICVAPTAAHCMSAIDIGSNGRSGGTGHIYVYRTRRMVKATKPYNVYDSHITREHWLLTKTRFTLVDKLDVSKETSWGRLSWDECQQKKDKRAIRSWCGRRDPRLSTVKHANQLWRKK